MMYYIKILIQSLICGLFAALPVSYGAHYAFLGSVLKVTNDKAMLGFYYAVISLSFCIVACFYLRRIYHKALFRSVFKVKGVEPEAQKSYRKTLLNLLLSLIPAAVAFVPVSKDLLVMDIFTNLLQENYLLVTASCCFGSGLFLLIGVWYTRQHYGEPSRQTKILSVLRFSVYQLTAHLLPGVSHVATGATSLLLSDVDEHVIVREVLLYLTPSMLVINVARVVRYILSGIVLSPLMVLVAAAGAALSSTLMIRLISRLNLRKHFLFFSIYSMVFGIFIAVSAFVF